MTGLDDILAGLKAAGEGTRFRLLALFTKAELTVSEVTQILRQSQPRVSRHLKLMSDAGLIERIREGTWVFYRLSEAGAGRALVERIDRIAVLHQRACVHRLVQGPAQSGLLQRFSDCPGELFGVAVAYQSRRCRRCVAESGSRVAPR